MGNAFIANVKPPTNQNERAYWMILNGFRLLVYDEKPEARLPYLREPSEIGITTIRRQYLGYFDHPSGPLHCYSAEVTNPNSMPNGMVFLSLRRLFTRLDDSMLALAGRAVQIVEWDRTHQFCGRCGITVQPMPHERAKKCPRCDLTSYPRLSPAIIVSIERNGQNGKEILLAHNQRHPAGFYSVLAGFVEPGESLEECVRREIREEVGIEVKNIRYFGSQPWPFPNSLMIAFVAEYAAGEIILEEDELEDAGWYTPDALPPVPPAISIARQMIDSFVEIHGKHS